MSPQPNPDRADALRYPVVFTPRLWDTAVHNNPHPSGSTFESRLLDLLHAVCKAHQPQPGAQRVDFELHPRLHTGRSTKQPSLALTLERVETDPQTPYLLISLKEEQVDA
ncbi:hypothetical protein HX882_27035 [Pseudomonas gingeri]|uniref:Uncharacterized protein n=1 Tax=Pseudomonas gingeri TaxID=117681 RepID=A0A7Y7XGR8_9PSED|nr:hypothetical protein [Pseudomonas gingeri]NWB99547.1 hypothetical protein [Pseudomonas gingeri]